MAAPRVTSLVVPALVLLASSSCTTDHGLLAARDDGTGGHTGADARPGAGQAGNAGAPADAAPSSPDAHVDAAQSIPVEPDGPRSLTIVHGVTDAMGPVLLCISRVLVDGEQPLEGAPWPASGLGYGASTVLGDGAPLDMARDGFRLHVFAGDLARLDGLDCAEAFAEAVRLEAEGSAHDGGAVDAGIASEGGSMQDAAVEASGAAGFLDAARPVDAALRDGFGADADGGPAFAPPPLRVRSLPVVPPGSLARERSYLLVAAGCLGGTAFTDPAETSICSEFYRPDQPTVAPVLVAPSRVVPVGSVGLQLLNAALPLRTAALVAKIGDTGDNDLTTVASGVLVGEIAPITAFGEKSVLLLGANGDVGVLRIEHGSTGAVLLDTPWADVRFTAAIARVEDERTYTAILIGPHPTYGARSWWQGSMLTLVESDPLAE